MFGLDVIAAVVWAEMLAYDEDNEKEDDDEEEWRGRELRTLADADQLAAELAKVVLERAVPFARRSVCLRR